VPRPLAAFAGLTGLAVLAAGGIGLAIAARDGNIPFVSDTCRVYAADHTVRLDPEQAGHAATIAAVAVRQELPERAVTVALATALQESKLRNLPDGDRDSVGLFQQRPSQGWGTPAQLQDPRYAARQFYRHLAQVDGWERMEIAVAAQAVQRSAEGAAYAKWGTDAVALARAFTGREPGAVTCRLRSNDAGTIDAAAAADLGSALRADVGTVSSDPPDGTTATRELTVPVGAPVASADPGWRVAYWFVAQSREYGVRTVRYRDLEWSAGTGRWQKPAAEQAPARRVVAELSGA
jgi:hypothetical protein